MVGKFDNSYKLYYLLYGNNQWGVGQLLMCWAGKNRAWMLVRDTVAIYYHALLPLVYLLSLGLITQ